MESWAEAGQDPALFWHLTLREVSIIMAGVAKRIEREQQFSEFNAWLGASLTMTAFHNPKKFPPFTKVSSAQRKRARQTWQQQKVLAQALNAVFGGEFRQK